ncbi:MAG: hypothetical protein DMF90_26065 [Acidobacteria bacterium]|nr:MAG: hypothetical protein DMF90_26065 [Acidobacteriota bacterium]
MTRVVAPISVTPAREPPSLRLWRRLVRSVPPKIEQREQVVAFLDSASEDEFTDHLLVPLFQRLGSHRVSPAGHTEKALEFGKDLWMKFQLPTGHWLYFCAQVKRRQD